MSYFRRQTARFSSSLLSSPSLCFRVSSPSPRFSSSSLSLLFVTVEKEVTICGSERAEEDSSSINHGYIYQHISCGPPQRNIMRMNVSRGSPYVGLRLLRRSGDKLLVGNIESANRRNDSSLLRPAWTAASCQEGERINRRTGTNRLKDFTALKGVVAAKRERRGLQKLVIC